MPLRTLSLAILLTLTAASSAPAAQGARAARADSSSETPAIVIGFTGGYVRRDNMVHGPVQLAEKLRHELPAGTYVGMFENRNGEQAHAEILRRLDASHAGNPSPEERRNARIVLYGHSWGASEVILLARELQNDGIPVLLTVQIDSVAKLRQNDSLIPANVAAAVNFYQTGGILHGQTEIRAVDPARTQVIGNYKFDYAAHPVGCYGAYPWYARVLVKAHTEIECDPAIWNQVDMMIRSRVS